MPARKKITDEALVTAYAELGNVHLVADQFGMCGQSIHERLVKLGIKLKLPKFTDEEYARLKRDYAHYREHGRVAQLAQEMGRAAPFLSRKAAELGIANASYKKTYAGKWKHMPESGARMLFDSFKSSRLQMAQWCKRHGYAAEGFSTTIRQFWPDEWEAVIEAKVPLQSFYRIGRAVEYRVRDQLREHGYFVLRSPGSRSPMDLIAIRVGVVLMIQCKRGGVLGPKSWNELFDLAESTGAFPILAEYPHPRRTDYWQLIARKDGSKRRQPMVRISITDLAVLEARDAAEAA